MNPKGNDPKFPTKPDGSRDVMYDWDPCTQTWEQMEALLKSGKTKAIGVSNWSIPKLEKLLKHAKVAPAANQIELHPYLVCITRSKRKPFTYASLASIRSTGILQIEQYPARGVLAARLYRLAAVGLTLYVV